MKIFDCNFNNNEDDGGSSKELFNERLKDYKKNIKLKKGNSEELKFITFFRDVFKIILAMPSVIYTHIKNEKNVKYTDSNNELNDNENVKTFNLRDKKIDNLDKNDSYNSFRSKSDLVDKIKDIDTCIVRNDNILNRVDEFKDTNISGNIEIKKRLLQSEILYLIEKRLIKNINQLEIIQSEFYIINKVGNDNRYVGECKDNILEIKNLLNKINMLKEHYDYLKSNIDFDNFYEYNDEYLVNKILELKDISTKGEMYCLVDDYKILEQYKFLYLKVDMLNNRIHSYEEYKKDQIKKLKDRDIVYEDIKNNVYDLENDKEKYNHFIKEQENLLEKLNDKIGKIDVNIMTSYKIKGLGKLMGNSFKYLGLLLINPFKGLIPGIASQTIVTRGVIRNLYSNLEFEEKESIVYETIDYSYTINCCINNLDFMSSMIDSTLDEIYKLKNKYNDKCLYYKDFGVDFKYIMGKIDEIEDIVLWNKVKVDLIKEQMKNNSKINNNNIIKVRKMNDDK